MPTHVHPITLLAVTKAWRMSNCVKLLILKDDKLALVFIDAGGVIYILNVTEGG
jgi:hypothetical protein